MTELWKYLVKMSDFIKWLKEFLVRVCIMHQFSKLLNTTWKHRHQREGKDSKQSSYTHCIRPFQSWKPRWHAHTNEPNFNAKCSPTSFGWVKNDFSLCMHLCCTTYTSSSQFFFLTSLDLNFGMMYMCITDNALSPKGLKALIGK
jgi:hypothetical protein